MIEHWGTHNSPWGLEGHEPRLGPLSQDLFVDVAIVGGGITGITCASFLKEAGLSVAVLTEGRIGGGTTGHSTGHITSVLDIEFETLKGKFGIPAAKKVVQATKRAARLVEHLSLKYKIDCSFGWVPGYRFTESSLGLEELENDFSAAQELGLNPRMTLDCPLPFPICAATRYDQQAQFNPLRFVQGLASHVVGGTCQIFEDTRVHQITDGPPCVLKTENGTVTAALVVLATHTPIGHFLSLHTRVAPYTSYVLAAEAQQPIPPALYWDTAAPYHYIRTAEVGGKKLLIVGGCDHKTGQETDTSIHYSKLEDYFRNRFTVGRMEYFWAHEFFEPVDGLPFIGRVPMTRSILCATGFSGNGLTWGPLAGRILADVALGNANELADIFDPRRVHPLASATRFTHENLNVARWMIGDRFKHGDIGGIDEILPGEGGLLEAHGKKIAVYRSRTGELVALSPKCTHMGCTVHWNDSDKTWDCPCHGGRYSPTGEVIFGPPLENLRHVDVEVTPPLTEVVARPAIDSLLEPT